MNEDQTAESVADADEPAVTASEPTPEAAPAASTTHSPAPSTTPPGAATDPSADAAPPQYGVGPFSLREVLLAAVWAVSFLLSFVSLTTMGFSSVWTSGLLWVLTIGVPTVAVFLVVLRRLSPQGIRRVGSLGIDQFASVAFSVSAVLWLSLVWETVSIVAVQGAWVRTWVIWVQLMLMLVGVVLTVLAPFLPGIGEDFRHRTPTTAHPNARPLRPVVPRPVVESSAPAPAAAVASEPAGAQTTAPTAHEVVPATGVTEVIEPVRLADAEPVQPVAQVFWALAPEERDVFDETGAPLFRIGPTAWALVVEDRGSLFVIRHEDGRIGYLHDVSGVTRA